MKTELDKFYGLIDEIKVAMLTTRRPDGHLESRAMANQKRAGGADLWFVTAEGTEQAARYRTRSPCESRVLPARLVRVGVGIGYREPVAGPRQDPRALRARLERMVRAGGRSAPRHGRRSSDRPHRHRRPCGGLSRGQQAETDRLVRAGEGLADRPTSGARRETRAGTAASIVTCAETAMPVQRYAIDLQPASRNPATNAAWSRRALGPRPQDLAYTSFLTRGEDTETSYRPPRDGPGTPGCRGRAAEPS